jgi:hypothetical protein
VGSREPVYGGGIQLFAALQRPGRPIAAATVALTCMCLLPAAASATTVPLPAGGDATASTELNAISCPAAGSCGAVGTYTDSGGDQQELLLSQSGGAWTATRGDLSALPSGYLYIPSIACPAAGDCVAVGSDTYASGNLDDAVIEAQAGGQWLPTEAADLPADAVTTGTDAGGFLTGVACTSSGNCTAVGSYASGSNTDKQPLVITEVNGTWERGTDPGLPSDATTSPGAQIYAVSCASAGDCAAVGGYNNSYGEQGLLLTETDGSWTTSAISTSGLSPSPDATDPNIHLRSVACPAAGACVAVGSYDTSDGTAGVVATESNGSWDASAPDLSQLGYASDDDLELESVSCVATASCTATGSLSSADATIGVVLRQSSSGAWQPSFQGPPPGSAAQPLYYTVLGSVSCAAQGTCAIAGFAYDVTASEPVGVLLGGPVSSWPYAQLPLNAPDPIAETGDDLAAVSCSPSGYCAFVGRYTSIADASHTSEQQMLLNYAPGPSGTVSADAGVGQASVSWQAPVDDGGLPVTGYTVTANDQTDSARGGQTLTTTGSAVTFTGLTGGDSYTFTVTANSLLGVGVGSSSGAVTIAEPATARSQITRAQIIATLKKLLTPTGKNATIKKIVKNNGFTLRYRALESGRLVIDWYYVTKKEKGKGKHRHKVKVKTLVADANVKITAAKSYSVKVKLTKAGKKLLKTHKRLKLTSRASFTPTGGKPITTTKTITLR